MLRCVILFLRTLALGSLFLAACGGTVTGPADSSVDAATDGGSSDGPADVFASDAPNYDSGGGACDGGACPMGLTCCGGSCKNLQNDPRNCGGCGVTCKAGDMCLGTCAPATCQPVCAGTQVCCEVNKGGPSSGPSCYDGVTCPVGCPLCQ